MFFNGTYRITGVRFDDYKNVCFRINGQERLNLKLPVESMSLFSIMALLEMALASVRGSEEAKVAIQKAVEALKPIVEETRKIQDSSPKNIKEFDSYTTNAVLSVLEEK
jgi:uncharacterized protein with von Willebrand factor type A (vWA) domain